VTEELKEINLSSGLKNEWHQKIGLFFQAMILEKNVS